MDTKSNFIELKYSNKKLHLIGDHINNDKEFLKLHQTNVGIAAEINRLLKNNLSKDKSFN